MNESRDDNKQQNKPVFLSYIHCSTLCIFSSAGAASKDMIKLFRGAYLQGQVTS